MQCQTGWTGKNCDACVPNFGPPGQCDQCLRGWTGINCTECATNFGPAGQCDTCLEGWDGDNCDRCTRDWTGENCNERCPLGWGGDNCDVCEFGFNIRSDCNECIQNGYWVGMWRFRYPMMVHLTFEGPTCSSVASGMY